MAVGLASGTYKLHLGTLVLELRSAKVAEHRHMSPSSESFAQGFGHENTTTHYDHINVFRGAFQEEVTHVAPHYITLQLQRIGRSRNLLEYLCAEMCFQLFCCPIFHLLSLLFGGQS